MAEDSPGRRLVQESTPQGLSSLGAALVFSRKKPQEALPPQPRANYNKGSRNLDCVIFFSVTYTRIWKR